MNVNLRQRHCLITWAGVLLLLAMAWPGLRYAWQFDLTDRASNRLSPATIKLLEALPDPVQITAYIGRAQSLRLQIGQLLARYQRHKANFSYRFVDPASQPERVRELEIGPQGAVLVEYQGRSQKINFLDESALTNALFQLSHAQQRWISFLTGHGERAASGVANFDYGRFGQALAQRNITAVDLNLALTAAVPENSRLLAIAGPRAALLPAEIKTIKNYLDRGGNLLLLTDPENRYLAPLLQHLGIVQLPGMLADKGGKLFGLDDLSIIIATTYPDHPIFRGMQMITVYPGVAVLAAGQDKGFKAQPVWLSTDTSWRETGPSKDAPVLDKSEQKGPLPFGWALTRTVNGHEQRLLVLGDGDFIANAYLDNVGNLDMGFRAVNWLIQDDNAIDIPVKVATDKTLQLSSSAVAWMGFGFLLALPTLFMLGGVWVWWVRRQK